MTSQTDLQADGITPLTVVWEVHLNVNRDHVDLHLDALVVDELDVDILAETPFMALTDISVRLSLQQISIQGFHILCYGAEGPDTLQTMYGAPSPMSYVLHHHLQSFGQESIYIQLPSQIHPDCILALEPRPDCVRSTRNWPIRTSLKLLLVMFVF